MRNSALQRGVQGHLRQRRLPGRRGGGEGERKPGHGGRVAQTGLWESLRRGEKEEDPVLAPSSSQLVEQDAWIWMEDVLLMKAHPTDSSQAGALCPSYISHFLVFRYQVASTAGFGLPCLRRSRAISHPEPTCLTQTAPGGLPLPSVTP